MMKRRRSLVRLVDQVNGFEAPRWTRGRRQMQWNRYGKDYGADAAVMYERYLAPLFSTWAMELTERASMQPGDRALDVACGTGVVTRAIVETMGAGAEVVGLDYNRSLLAVARGVRPEMTWCAASADALPFASDTFDVVLCQFGLMYFSDRLATLAEMHRVLRAGGRLLISVWRSADQSPGFAALADALGRYVGPDAAALPQYSLGNPKELESMLAKADFCEVAVSPLTKTARFPSPSEFVRRYSLASAPIVALFDRMSGSARAAIIEHVETLLRPYVFDDGLAFPMGANLAMARKPVN